jgi:hypothetical protein
VRAGPHELHRKSKGWVEKETRPHWIDGSGRRPDLREAAALHPAWPGARYPPAQHTCCQKPSCVLDVRALDFWRQGSFGQFDQWQKSLIQGFDEQGGGFFAVAAKSYLPGNPPESFFPLMRLSSFHVPDFAKDVCPSHGLGSRLGTLHFIIIVLGSRSHRDSRIEIWRVPLSTADARALGFV